MPLLEPFPKNWYRFCDSLRRNAAGFIDRVTLHPVALMDVETDVFFHGPRTNLAAIGTVKVRTYQAAVAAEKGSTTTSSKEVQLIVPGRTVDSILLSPRSSMEEALMKEWPIILKMDVERSECLALTGGIQFFKRANIVWATMELFQKIIMNKCKTRNEIYQLFLDKGLTLFTYENKVFRQLDVKLADDWRQSDGKSRIFDVVWEKA
jgi:hypothetical protein